MKVLVYGSINIDLVFSVDHILTPGETLNSKSLKQSAGGKGANQAAALAKAGSDVYFAGKAGEGSKWILDLLQSYNVKLDYLSYSPNPNGQAIIQLDRKSKQNAILLFSGSNGEVTQEEIDNTLSHFEAGDCLVLQNEIPHIDYLINQAYEKDMYIVLNPSPMNEVITSLDLQKVNLLVVNENEGAALANLSEDSDYIDILNKLESLYPSTELVLTAGSRGAYYQANGNMVFSSATKVKPLDTTGAGDTFLGYFLTYKNEGMSPENALLEACYAAGIAVSRFGAMQAIPTREEVDK